MYYFFRLMDYHKIVQIPKTLFLKAWLWMQNVRYECRSSMTKCWKFYFGDAHADNELQAINRWKLIFCDFFKFKLLRIYSFCLHSYDSLPTASEFERWFSVFYFNIWRFLKTKCWFWYFPAQITQLSENSSNQSDFCVKLNLLSFRAKINSKTGNFSNFSSKQANIRDDQRAAKPWQLRKHWVPTHFQPRLKLKKSPTSWRSNLSKPRNPKWNQSRSKSWRPKN